MSVKDSSKIEFFTLGVEAERGKVIAVGESMTMLYGEFEPGAETPEHSHPHEQMGYCLKGLCELTVDSKTFILKEGHTWIIPPNARHNIRNIGKEIFAWIDVWHPPREDLLRGIFDSAKWTAQP